MVSKRKGGVECTEEGGVESEVYGRRRSRVGETPIISNHNSHQVTPAPVILPIFYKHSQLHSTAVSFNKMVLITS